MNNSEIIIIPFIKDYIINNKILNELEQENIFYYIDKYNPYNIKNDELKYQFYILYAYTFLFNKVYELFCKENVMYLYPNIKSFLINKLKLVNEFLFKSIKNIYKIKSRNYKNIFKIKIDNVIDDVIHMFLVNNLMEINPINIKEIVNYYNNILSYIMNFYLKNKYLEVAKIVNKRNEQLIKRYYIYKKSIELTQMNFNNKLDYNLNKFRKQLTNNELQKLVLLLIYKEAIKDNYLCVIRINFKDDLKDYFSSTPLFYDIITSIRLNKKEKNFYDFVLTDFLIDIINKNISLYFSKEYCEILSKVLANSIQDSINNGIFINPITLEEIIIDREILVNELKTVFDKIFKYDRTIEKRI